MRILILEKHSRFIIYVSMRYELYIYNIYYTTYIRYYILYIFLILRTFRGILHFQISYNLKV